MERQTLRAVGVVALLSLYFLSLSSADPLQAGNRFPLGLHLGGEVENCTEETVGLLRFHNNEVQVCRNNSWGPVSSGDVHELNERLLDIEQQLGNHSGPGCCPATNQYLQQLARISEVQVCHGRGRYNTETEECECRCDLVGGCYNVASSCGTCAVGYTGVDCNHCASGFVLSNANECVDIDECADGNRAGCLETTECVNTPGGFECLCRDGFEMIEGICQGAFHAQFEYLDNWSSWFYGGQWTAIPLNTDVFSYGVHLDSEAHSFRFDHTGTYALSVSFRRGSREPEDYVAVRLRDITTGETAAVSASSRTIDQNDPSGSLYTLTAQITSTESRYELQVGRPTHDIQLHCCPAEIVDYYLPVVAASITYVNGPHAVLAVPAQTFLSNVWTPIAFLGRVSSAGVDYVGGSNNQLQFSRSGGYSISLDVGGWIGSSANAWTAVRLWDLDTASVVGVSDYTAHGAGDIRGHAWTLLGSVESDHRYQLQIGRLNGDLTLVNPSMTNLLGETISHPMYVHIHHAPLDHIELGAAPQTLDGEAWTTLEFNEVGASSGISYVGSTVDISRPGVYNVRLGHRGGTGNDVWMGVRLVCDGQVVGRSTAFGKVGGADSIQYQYEFLAHIPPHSSASGSSSHYYCQVQYGRDSHAATVSTPGAITGVPGSAFRVQIVLQAMVTDECSSGTHDCASGQTCTDTSGSYICSRDDCPEGYSGDTEGAAAVCTWEDECLVDNGGCHPLADCAATESGDTLTCTCPSELSGNGIQCGEDYAYLVRESLASIELLAGEWRPIEFTRAVYSHGITLPLGSGSPIRFPSAGTFTVSFSFRPGTSTGVEWLAVRLRAPETDDVIAVSSGSRQMPTNDPSLLTFQFLATVVNATREYVVEIGRRNEDMVIFGATSTTIDSIGPYMVTCSIVRTRGHSAQFEVTDSGKVFGQTDIWDSLSYSAQNMAHGGGVTLGDDKSAIYFTRPGMYRIGVSYVDPSAADRWTSFRLWDDYAEKSRGYSHSGANSASNDERISTYYLLARVPITGLDRPYRIQVGRHTTSSARYPIAIPVVPDVAGMSTIPGMIVTVEEVPRNSAYLYAGYQSFPGEAWTPLVFSLNEKEGAWTRPTTTTVSVPEAGMYSVTIGYRSGTGDDRWTSGRMVCNSQPVGMGVWYGKHSGGASGNKELEFLAAVPEDGIECEIQIGRSDSSLALAEVQPIDDYTSAAVGVVITQISRHVDECSSGWDSCGSNDACVDTIGGYECHWNGVVNASESCSVGFERTVGVNAATECVDIDECADSVCSEDAVCTNTPGSFDCACFTGLIGNGFNCSSAGYAQLERTVGSHFSAAGNAWTGIGYTDAPLSKAVALVGGTPTTRVLFDNPGSYAVSANFRFGGSTPDWTSVRMIGDSESLGNGVSAGYQEYHAAHAANFYFHGNVSAGNQEHHIEVGRSANSLAVNCCPCCALSGRPSMVSVVRSLSNAYGELRTDTLVVPAHSWQSIAFTSSRHTRHIHTSTTNTQQVFFDRPGYYFATVSYRTGTGSDVWTSARVWDPTSSEVRGYSYGTGNVANDARSFPMYMMVYVPDSVVQSQRPYEFQLGRHNSAMTTADPPDVAGESIPGLTVDISYISGDFIQLNGPTQSLAGNAVWNPVAFDGNSHRRGISRTNGNTFSITSPGVYHVTFGFRTGGGSDVWMAPRLFCDGVEAGAAAPSGMAGNGDPGATTYNFLANVQFTPTSCQLQFLRVSGAAQSIANPATIDGWTPPAVVTTIEQIEKY